MIAASKRLKRDLRKIVSRETAMKTYSYKIDGSNHEGRAWTTRGRVDCEFENVFTEVTKASFDQLTQGKAVFDHPGEGCSGPYGVHRVLIEEVQQ
jgi:hypothetical protein